MKAIFNGQVIAESDGTVVVENNHYFPTESVHMEFLQVSGNHYTCPWKGVCDYYNVVVNDKTAADGAWTYQQPKELAKHITGHFAFWHGVEVTE